MEKNFQVEGVDHIGIVTDGSERLFHLLKSLLGLSFLGKEVVEEQKTEVSFFKPVGKENRGTALELLEPTESESVIARYREKNKKGIHHIALRVRGLELAIAHLLNSGVEMVHPEPRLGHGGCKVAFIHPKYTSGILIELVEK